MPDRHITKPLWLKITAYGFGAVLFASVAIGGLALYRQYQAGEVDLLNRFDQSAALVSSDIEGQKRLTSAVALAIAGEPGTGELLEKNGHDALIQRLKSNFATMKTASNISSITFADANAHAVARVHLPERFGDDMSTRRQTVLAAIRQGTIQAGIEQGLSSLCVFASAPAFNAAGKVSGVADVGTCLTPDYFARLKTSSHSDLAVQILHDGHFEVQSKTGTAYLTQDELHAVAFGASVHRMVDADGQSLMIGGMPLVDYRGERIGVLEMARDVTSVAQARSGALWSATLMTGLVCIIVLAAFLVFARALGGALERLTSAMASLASGKLDTEVPSLTRPDEIGAMARAVEIFKTMGIEKIRIEGEAAESGHLAGQERARHEAEQARSGREQSLVVGQLADGLVRLAEGDLTARLHQPFAAAYEKLRTDFNAAVERLQTTMRAVAGNTSSIHNGSGEIAQAADDLARRTEQQAASLEETAAALDQITATVKQTADGARQAKTVVAAAKTDAEQSGAVVRDAVGAMTEIERSSREISQIIGVIDEIAFQTNLLALNAGVEAARAGDAGRGFAVVASEVRALAQRSAEAAKQIKGLIHTSTNQVEAGVDLVGRTGLALDRIAVQVAEVNAIVATISVSAQEQATGLQQVNTAVNQMDQVTQQNAAMVEQSTAASHNLLQEASELSALLARFRLGEDGAGTARYARAA